MAGVRFSREAGKPRLAEAPPADSAVDTEVEASELLTRLEEHAAESGRLEGQAQTLERALEKERDGRRRLAATLKRERKAALRAEPIDDSPGKAIPDGIGELKREHDVRVIHLAPGELLLERRFQQPDDLAVDVVDRRRQEEHGANHPAHVADSLRNGGDGFRGGQSHVNR